MSINSENDFVLPGKSDGDHGKEENEQEEATKDKNETDEYTFNTLVGMNMYISNLKQVN